MEGKKRGGGEEAKRRGDGRRLKEEEERRRGGAVVDAASRGRFFASDVLSSNVEGGGGGGEEARRRGGAVVDASSRRRFFISCIRMYAHVASFLSCACLRKNMPCSLARSFMLLHRLVMARHHVQSFCCLTPFLYYRRLGSCPLLNICHCFYMLDMSLRHCLRHCQCVIH